MSRGIGLSSRHRAARERSGAEPAAAFRADVRALRRHRVERPAHQRGQRRDEGLADADRRHARIVRDASSFGEFAILDVELDQGLRVLADEGDRGQHERALVGAGASDLRVGRRADPFERADPALIAHPPVEALDIEPLDDATRSRNSMWGNGMAFVISNLVAYVINIYWVFVPGRYPWIVEIALFYLVSGVSIAIGTALMGFLIRRFGILTTYAFGSNIFTAVMINYALRKYVIFLSLFR